MDDHATPIYPQKLALNFVDKWGSLVGVVHLRTKGHGVCLLCVNGYVGVPCALCIQNWLKNC
jgi:hypothetical protein